MPLIDESKAETNQAKAQADISRMKEYVRWVLNFVPSTSGEFTKEEAEAVLKILDVIYDKNLDVERNHN